MNLILLIFLLFLTLIILILLNNTKVVVTNTGEVNSQPNHYKMVNAYDDIQGTCAETHFGCCPDGVNSKMNIFGSNCSGYGRDKVSEPVPAPAPRVPKYIGGCAGTIFGCCANGETPKMDKEGTNCILHH